MTHYVYRKSNPSAHSKNTFKDAPLTLSEIDGNFKGIEENKLDFEEISFLFKEIGYWLAGASLVYTSEDGEEYTVMVSDDGEDYYTMVLRDLP